MKRRLKIRPKDLRYFAVFVIAATIISSGVAFSTLNPAPSDQFLAMWILGSNGLAEHYYPGDNPNLKMGQNVNWTLGIYNHMGSLQYIVVRAKLLNSTQAGPNEITSTPSPVSSLFEFTRVLVDNETWSIPFEWKITQITQTGQSLVITGLSINQTLFKGELARAVSGFNLRFVFELWFYDAHANSLAFSWQTAGVQRSVWTQIWFNATATQ